MGRSVRFGLVWKALNPQQTRAARAALNIKRRVLGGLELATSSPCESVAEKMGELVMAEKIYGN